MEKPVLCLLPGLLSDATIWRHQIAALSASHDVRVADYRECGSILAMAESVLAWAPPLFALAGHSMGGRVALQVMRLAPARVTRLALLSTGPEPAAPDEPAKRQALLDICDTHGMQALARAWLLGLIYPPRQAEPALMAPLADMVRRMSPAIVHRQIKALLERPDASAVLAAIRCPVLIGVGRQDRWSPPRQHAAMAGAIGAADYILFEQCGHMAPVEAPAAVNDSLRRWLA